MLDTYHIDEIYNEMCSELLKETLMFGCHHWWTEPNINSFS